jgi:hypothetical protein
LKRLTPETAHAGSQGLKPAHLTPSISSAAKDIVIQPIDPTLIGAAGLLIVFGRRCEASQHLLITEPVL